MLLAAELVKLVIIVGIELKLKVKGQNMSVKIVRPTLQLADNISQQPTHSTSSI